MKNEIPLNSGDDEHVFQKVARQLNDTAFGKRYCGEALRVAKYFPFLSPEEIIVIKRWEAGEQTSADFYSLQRIAIKILETSPACRASASELIQEHKEEQKTSLSKRDENFIKLLIWTDGDTSVGLSGERAELNLPIDGFFDETDSLEFVRDAKEIFARAFSELWGDRARVATADELAAQAEHFEGGVSSLSRMKG